MNEEINFNEVKLSGIISSIFECNNGNYIAFGLTCKKYFNNKNNNQVYVSLRIYKDLYNIYKDFFIKGKKVYIKGYVNSYADSSKKINNYIMVTKIFNNANDLLTGREYSCIGNDLDGVMTWNGKRCEKISPTKEELEEMNNILKEFK